MGIFRTCEQSDMFWFVLNNQNDLQTSNAQNETTNSIIPDVVTPDVEGFVIDLKTGVRVGFGKVLDLKTKYGSSLVNVDFFGENDLYEPQYCCKLGDIYINEYVFELSTDCIFDFSLRNKDFEFALYRFFDDNSDIDFYYVRYKNMMYEIKYEYSDDIFCNGIPVKRGYSNLIVYGLYYYYVEDDKLIVAFHGRYGIEEGIFTFVISDKAEFILGDVFQPKKLRYSLINYILKMKLLLYKG